MEESEEQAKKEAEYQAKDLKSKKFSKLVIEMLQDGKMWFSESDDRVDVVIEFPGGGEAIGNPDIGGFSWKDVMNMAESQGLLK